MTIAIEEQRIRSLLGRVEAVEDVARTLPEDDERRVKLLAVSSAALADEGTIRPVIAARLLGLSEKTVRAWAAQGVLTVAQRTPRLLLDLQSVHVISHLVRDLRELGKDRDLLDEVWRRLSDTALLERPDLQESIQQMHKGEGRALRPEEQRADDEGEHRGDGAKSDLGYRRSRRCTIRPGRRGRAGG
jgi:DNA-binding transcriptional MerR regulator